MTIKKLLSRFAQSRSGATAIEYGFIALFIALAIIISVNSIGSGLDGVFTAVASGI